MPHNIFLKEWNIETNSFNKEVELIIDQMLTGGEVGSVLLGLTTKTVQELAMSSENCKLNIGLSILFSILYAPLIYYHNIRLEVDRNEMIPLQPFDTDYDLWVPWIERTRAAIDSPEGEGYREGVARKEARAAQIRMAYQCFQPLIPPHIERELRGIYLEEKSNEPS